MPTKRFFVLAALFVAASLPSQAAEISAFLASTKPNDNWNGGAGVAFGINFLQVLHFEAELARIPGELDDQSHVSVMGSAFVAPSIGRVVPYAGLGVGGYHQKDRGEGDSGVERNFVVGVKVKLGLVFVKGEYRKINLPDDALIAMDHRFSVGAGIAF